MSNQEFLARLSRFHRELEQKTDNVEFIDSLYNARNIVGVEENLLVTGLLATLPETEEQLAAVRKRAMDSPLVSSFFQTTTATRP